MAKKPEYNYKSLQTEYGKMPPQAVDLEEAILGSLMLEKDAFITVSDFLKPECFYKEAHQKIYRGIQNLSLNNEPVDILTVSTYSLETSKHSGRMTLSRMYSYMRCFWLVWIKAYTSTMVNTAITFMIGNVLQLVYHQ